jgi:hypothetical protein
MDKKIYLKKEPSLRKTNKTYPLLSTNEYIYYLKCEFIATNLKPEEEIIMKNIKKEIKKKQQSYKTQDITKQKYNDTTFISEEEIYEKLLSSAMICYYCKNPVCIFYSEVRQPNQWTLERINNTYGHSSKNTVIACLDCNIKRRDKNSNAFQFAKQLVIKKI